MYAIVNIAGQQFKVQKDQSIFVHRLEGDEGKKLNFTEVLLVDEGGKVTVGAPHIEGASVSAKILNHARADKVLVFKKKRRKGYQKLNGHRQYMTKIQVEKIQLKGSGAKQETADADVKPVAAKKLATKKAVKKEE